MSPNRVNRREFLTWCAAAVAVPPRPFDATPAQDTPLPAVSWTCPMHPEVVDDQSGMFPICTMQLTPVRLDLVWTCPLHLDVTQERPGRCRT